MLPKRRSPAHPGDILKRLFLDSLKLTQSDLARHLKCKPGKINEIINKKRDVSVKMALSLADALGTTAEFWLNLQNNFDLYKAKKEHKKIKLIGD